MVSTIHKKLFLNLLLVGTCKLLSLFGEYLLAPFSGKQDQEFI